MAFEIEVERTVEPDEDKWWWIMSMPQGWDLWFTENAVFTQGTYETDNGDFGKFTEIVPYSSMTFTWENPKHPAGSSVRFSVGEDSVRIAHFDIPTEELAKELEAAWNRVADKLAAL
jgi:hypothetical protein